MDNSLEKSVALVIGNGYDLSLGLNTRYSDFIYAVEQPTDDFTLNANEQLKNNELFLHLATNENENEKWIDAEYELGEYIKLCEEKISYHKSRKQKDQANEVYRKTKSDYFELKKYLKSYLMNIENNITRFQNEYSRSSAFKLTNDLINSDTKHFEIISFNYTNSFDTLHKLLKEYSIEKTIKHVHGNLKTDIVFGIDDKTIISKDFVYILKSYDKNTLNINYNKLLNNSNKIIFFGYSLGESDQSYFKDFFIECCKYNDKTEEERREIIFYYKDEDGYQNLFYRLKEMTEHNTANFMKYNTVEFIDVNSYRSCFRELQKTEMWAW